MANNKNDPKASEIIIALVGPVGTDLNIVSDTLIAALDGVGYTTHNIKLSSLFKKLPDVAVSSPLSNSEIARINFLMDAGDRLRERTNDGGIVAQLAVDEIRKMRKSKSKSFDTPSFHTAYILNSLKHPGEIEFLRSVYGSSFWVISVYEPYESRRKNLQHREKLNEQPNAPFVVSEEDRLKADIEIADLVDRDKGRPKQKNGQNVGKAFHLADIFVSAQNKDITGFSLQEQINRFIGLLFGAPFITPTKDEYGSFYAYAASLKSADLSRQVGATITTSNGEIIATGCNEVPSAGGGMYWEGCNDTDNIDHRDFQLGVDANAEMKNENVREIISAFQEAGWLNENLTKLDAVELTNRALYDKKMPILKETGIANIIEFGRIVHAEMTAITDAARRGIGVKDATLYSTTFPCHVCARHIIAAGIKRVVYIEPYPKSRAGTQYKNIIMIDDETNVDRNFVKFDAFMGVAPGVFIQLFKKVERKTDYGYAFSVKKRNTIPKISNIAANYLEPEQSVIETLIGLGIISKDEASLESQE